LKLLTSGARLEATAIGRGVFIFHGGASGSSNVIATHDAQRFHRLCVSAENSNHFLGFFVSFGFVFLDVIGHGIIKNKQILNNNINRFKNCKD